VITHGGLGTTLRALAHGIPLLLLPLGRDQQFNAGRVVELGAGMRLPVESSPDEIALALVELLAQPQFRELHARGPGTAGLRAEEAHRAGGGTPRLGRGRNPLPGTTHSRDSFAFSGVGVAVRPDGRSAADPACHMLATHAGSPLPERYCAATTSLP
jgi:hypothetical protein